MSYVVIARRYRPMQFDEVVGQEHITQTLANAIKNGRIGQAYIFSGPRGVGKTTTARILAMALNAEEGPTPTPDINSPVCQAIIQGRSMDVMEIDGASNRRIEEIRNLRENINYTPSESRYRIYIIDEVHMLTNEAFNALLKTLEEPPPHAVFIFATTEIHRVPATILSRCQRYDFKRIPINTIVAHLENICKQENISAEADALLEVAKKADGSMRDSQSILDQIISFSGESVTLQSVQQALGVLDREILFTLSALIRGHDSKAILLQARELFTSGVDLTELLMALEEHFRNLLVCRAMGSAELLDVSEAYAERYVREAAQYEERDLLSYLTLTGQALQDMKWASHPYLKFELSLIKMAHLPTAQSVETLLEKLKTLKKKALTPKPSPQVAEPQPEMDLSALWLGAIRKIGQTSQTLGAILEQAELVETAPGLIRTRLHCEAFNRDRVEKKRSELEKYLCSLAGAPVKLDMEYIIEKAAIRSDTGASGPDRQKKLAQLEKLKKENPVFGRFVEELGLEPDF
ncbi:MAG: DNA polymerase III subunit gamma/tau [Calditrichaeota bacterium]|nr:MAG: DNA polymerase III subunit gamma/tau [Calditrichota bacterium]